MEGQTHNTFKEVHLPPYAEYMTQGSVQVAPNRDSAPQVSYSMGPEVHTQAEESTAAKSQPLDSTTMAAPAAATTKGAAATPSSLPEKVPDAENAGAGSGRRGFAMSRKAWLITAAIAIVAIVAIVVGAVVGTRNSRDDENDADSSTTTTAAATNSAGATPSSSSLSPPTSISTPTAGDIKIGTSFSSSFTLYGSNDEGGSQNCSVSRMACGFHSNPGFTASVSENLYGSIKLAGNSVACGTCWRLQTEVDASNRKLDRSIVVMVNNICPAQGNPICGQRTLQEENEWGAEVNFNLCLDTGASDALFGRNSGIGLAVGNATRVDCDDWDGKRGEAES